MKQASKDTRERAIESWKSGTPINDICKVLGISRKTFYNWRQRDAEGGEQASLPKGHPPRLLTQDQLTKIKEWYEADNSLYAREVMEKLGIECHLGVIYRTLAELGLTFKKRDKSFTTRFARGSKGTFRLAKHAPIVGSIAYGVY